jgi:hypothetical protein
MLGEPTCLWWRKVSGGKRHPGREGKGVMGKEVKSKRVKRKSSREEDKNKNVAFKKCMVSLLPSVIWGIQRSLMLVHQHDTSTCYPIRRH